MVCLDASSEMVVKSAHDEGTQEYIDAEQRVCERLRERGGHPGNVLQRCCEGEYDDVGMTIEDLKRNRPPFPPLYLCVLLILLLSASSALEFWQPLKQYMFLKMMTVFVYFKAVGEGNQSYGDVASPDALHSLLTSRMAYARRCCDVTL
nr:hypothetical protein CFP56_31001 [Quercus suber]